MLESGQGKSFLTKENRYEEAIRRRTKRERERKVKKDALVMVINVLFSSCPTQPVSIRTSSTQKITKFNPPERLTHKKKANHLKETLIISYKSRQSRKKLFVFLSLSF